MTDRRKKKLSLLSSTGSDARRERSEHAEAWTEPGNTRLRVVNSWPSTIPIGVEEVRAIEVYLGKLIDLLVQDTGTRKSGPE